MHIPSALPMWKRTSGYSWHVCMERWQWGVLREAACSAISKTWKSLLYSQHRDTPVPPHLAPSRKSSCEANGVNRKLHKRCNFESKWSLSSEYKAEEKLSLQKKAVTEQEVFPPPTVCHWPRRIWLSWEDHFKYSFSSPLPRWPALPQLPWAVGQTHPSESVWKGWPILSSCMQGPCEETPKHSGPMPGDSEKEGIQSWAFGGSGTNQTMIVFGTNSEKQLRPFLARVTFVTHSCTSFSVHIAVAAQVQLHQLFRESLFTVVLFPSWINPTTP